MTSYGKAFGATRLDGELITDTAGNVYAYSDGDFVIITGGQEQGRITSVGQGSGFFSSAAITAPPASGSAATDVSNLQAAINATPTGGTLIIPDGLYKLNSGLQITKQMTLRSASNKVSTGANGCRFTTSNGATGPFFNVAPGALVHGIHLSGLSVDLSATPTETAFYATNIDNSFWNDLFVRDGACAFQLDGVQYFTQRDCMAFNQRTRGYYSSGASNVDIRWDNCQYAQTIGATWAVNAAWELAQGASFMFDHCEGLRSPAGSSNWMSYGLLATTPSATAWIFMENTWFDAASDGTGANSANSAAAYFNQVVNVKASGSFFSASASAGQKQRAVRINGGSDMHFTGCTFGGSGIEFSGGTTDRAEFLGNNYVGQFGDAALTFTGGAAPTNGAWKNMTIGAGAPIVNSAADATTFHTWTKGMNTDG